MFIVAVIRCIVMTYCYSCVGCLFVVVVDC